MEHNTNKASGKVRIHCFVASSYVLCDRHIETDLNADPQALSSCNSGAHTTTIVIQVLRCLNGPRVELMGGSRFCNLLELGIGAHIGLGLDKLLFKASKLEPAVLHVVLRWSKAACLDAQQGQFWRQVLHACNPIKRCCFGHDMQAPLTWRLTWPRTRCQHTWHPPAIAPCLQRDSFR